MASVGFNATTVPNDLVPAAGLAVGTTYECQNLSTTATLFLRIVAPGGMAPSLGDRAFKIQSGSPFQVRADRAGEAIYLWTDDPDGCPVIVNEAI